MKGVCVTVECSSSGSRIIIKVSDEKYSNIWSKTDSIQNWNRWVCNQILTLLSWQLIEQRDLKNEKWVSEEKTSPRRKAWLRQLEVVGPGPGLSPCGGWPPSSTGICCPPKPAFHHEEVSGSWGPWRQSLQRLDRLPGLSGAPGPWPALAQDSPVCNLGPWKAPYFLCAQECSYRRQF